MNPTFGDLIAFILLNRSDKVFNDMPEEQIAQLVYRKIQEKLLWYTVDDTKITGMIIATKHEDTKILFIDWNMAMNLSNLKKFARRAKQEFEGYQLEWYKHGVHQMPNTDKVYAKLS